MPNSVTNLAHIYIDGFDFTDIGREQLKVVNQLTYRSEPSRSTTGSMTNVNDKDTFVVASVEVGFKLIKEETFALLRQLLLAKRTFIMVYYDADFNQFVAHEVYAQPDELKSFLNYGEEVRWVRDFTLTFVSLLNGKDKLLGKNFFVKSGGVPMTSQECVTAVKKIGTTDNPFPATFTATFGSGSSATTRVAEWGRAVVVPVGTWKIDFGDEDLEVKEGERFTLFEDTTFTAVT